VAREGTDRDPRFMLAHGGELGRDGVPWAPQLAGMVSRCGEVIRPAGPPWPMLEALAGALGPIARRHGDRAQIPD